MDSMDTGSMGIGSIGIGSMGIGSMGIGSMPSMLSMSGSIISMPLFMDMGAWGQFDG